MPLIASKLYPSDLTDAELGAFEPLIPPGKPGGVQTARQLSGGDNGVMYILSTGCHWRAQGFAQSSLYLSA